MTLIQAWGDSLSLLKLKHLKLFLLVTLKSIIDTYKVLLKYWWWLLVLSILCGIVFFKYGLRASWLAWNIQLWSYQILEFATLVAARPSLEQKNCAYFRRYMVNFLPVALLLLLLPKQIWPMGLSPIYSFTVLFFLDSSKTIEDFFISFFRAIKMFIYNLPLLIIIAFVPLNLPLEVLRHINISSLLTPGITLFHISAVLDIIRTLYIPVYVCLYTNIYIKKLHDQFDLYFKQPS